MLTTQMRVEGLSKLNGILQDMDRKSANAMRAKMRASIISVAREIANDVPQTAPLSGMNHEGVTRWAGVPKASVSFTPGRAKSRSTRILSMKFTGGSRTGGGIGFDYAELAGNSSRPGRRFTNVYEKGGIPGFQHRVTGQGRAFNRGIKAAKPIKGKAGYFVYDSAFKRRGQLEGLGQRAINEYMGDVYREIQRIRAAR